MQNNNFQLSIPGTPIRLDRSQLFFLESFLKKNVEGLRIIDGFKLTDGVVQFKICSETDISGLTEVLKEVINYLLIFQFGAKKNVGKERMVKVIRKRSLKNNLKPARLYISNGSSLT